MRRAQAYFLTGTDTGVGKTFAAAALLHAAGRHGHTTLGMKPVSAGADATGSDIDRLLAAGSVEVPRHLVNPFSFAAPVAPHIAAADERRPIDIDVIRDAFTQLTALAEFVVVEGVGGFRVPLGDAIDTADLAQALDLPVILVVGLRLGCINHALLTAEAIHARGLGLAGWIANCIDPAMARVRETVAALESRIDAPLLGLLPWQERPDAATMAPRLSLPNR
jgi:dethiobiotin synthetase